MGPPWGLWRGKVAPDVPTQSNVMAEAIPLASLSTPANATEPAEALRPDGGCSVKPQRGNGLASDVAPTSSPCFALKSRSHTPLPYISLNKKYGNKSGPYVESFRCAAK
jgi:hypothetical protein